MLTVLVPDNCRAEREYLLAVIFREFLGIPVQIVFESRIDVAIVDENRCGITLSDRFFQLANTHWLHEKSLPKLPINWWTISGKLDRDKFCGNQLPLVFADLFSSPLIEQKSPQQLVCNLDIFGTVFFFLTRYEEVVLGTKDDHERFPDSASLSYRGGFLDRPIVDEYVELLWQLLHTQWPGLRRKQHGYQLYLSHDVDTPYWIFARPAWEVALALCADVSRRKGLQRAFHRARTTAAVYSKGSEADPYNSFSFILSNSERHGLRNAFYFITRRSRGRLDGTHRFESPPIQSLLKRLRSSGHEIGLHPSYATFNNPKAISEEFTALRQQCEQLGIEQSTWGGRQHYLRWQNPVTWNAWAQAGIDYDSTLGFSHETGFRCGSCREFSTYDLHARQPLSLRERPLIVMDCAMSYRHPQPDDSCFERVERLQNNCRRMCGNFTLLWHNNNLATEAQRNWYSEILSMAA